MATTTTPPKIALVPVTDEARLAIGKRDRIVVSEFPFRIGRESRSVNPLTRMLDDAERRLGTKPQLNDLYLVEPAFAQLLHISREHCSIDYIDGEFFVVDRSSACGTTVVAALAEEGRSTIAATHAGGDRSGGRSIVRTEDLLVLGAADSPYVYRFQVLTDAA